MTLALYVKYASSSGSYGEVALRAYFESGTGAEDDPFIITRPRHMYNLSRLQGLGVFGEKKYFKLGFESDDPSENLCYVDDSSMTKVPFLDMSGAEYAYGERRIQAIGNEAFPFVSEFDGQNLEIKGLTVYADPQDAGLFGYTAHGSVVKNLFLDDITINTLGYHNTYDWLYDETSELASDAAFSYDAKDGGEAKIYSNGTANYARSVFNAISADNFTFDGDTPIPEATPIEPIDAEHAFTCETLISGELLTEVGGVIKPDIAKVFEVFSQTRQKADQEYPVQALSTVSLIASTTDDLGIEHTRVLLTLTYIFTLSSANDTSFEMEVRNGVDHSQNIGLAVGHCDGTMNHVYVHDGHFIMNDGDSITGSAADTYRAMENASSIGIVGLVGKTVENVAAVEAGTGTEIGKDIGVLDFTTIYDEIIGPDSFPDPEVSASGGVVYYPRSTDKYDRYLRSTTIGGERTHVTLTTDVVSFNRQQIISNSDLGVFTIATDSTGTGMDDDVGNGLDNSAIKYQDVSIGSSSDYFLYYGTGEYQRSRNISFDSYSSSFNSNNPSEFLLGYHLPSASDVTVQSFAQRELHHNYYFRFKLDHDYRSRSNRFYFSDVDRETPGGSYLAKYFNSKLVDQHGESIGQGTAKSGVMLRNSIGKEIDSFAASFKTPDFSNGQPNIYAIEDDSANPLAVANMINFEVKAENGANVTVVASPTDSAKAAAVGIYDTENRGFVGSAGTVRLNADYNNPDYAFFMPDHDHLAYFDYKVSNDVGEIGVYTDSAGETFVEADVGTDPTIASSSGLSDEYGADASKPRLFVHTFKLPQGKYCIGSATGVGTSGFTTANIYYMCAQGQDDGQISLANAEYIGDDKVNNIDFLKQPRFTYDESTGTVTTNITFGTVTSYDPSDSKLENQRAYVFLDPEDRSIFGASLVNLSFAYADGKLVITSTTMDGIEHVAVKSFGANHGIEGLGNTTVSLFGTESANDSITYTRAG